MTERLVVPNWRLFGRAVVIMTVVLGAAISVVPVLLAGLLTGGPPGAQRAGFRLFVRTLQVLGPTFVKFGQTSSTRRDAMPGALCDELGTLYDAARPMSARAAARALRLADITELVEVGDRPVASGSIASVYQGVLADGRVVAVKLKRPGIDARMRADLALVQRLVRLCQRMPSMRGMPMADLVGYMSEAILGQLDFAREARNIARLRECFATAPHVRVPAVYRELCTPNCLIFEYLPNLHTDTPGSLPADVRAALANRTLTAANRMMFVEGFVHCDLHPGNLYVTSDQRVVILDAGYCVQLPDRVRDLIGEFFTCLAKGDGRRCGEIVLESAVETSDLDTAAFVSDMAEIIERHSDPDHPFDMKVFGDAVFKLQQRHGIYAASDFAFPLMGLNVLDGTVRRIEEEVDFRHVGVPATAA